LLPYSGPIQWARSDAGRAGSEFHPKGLFLCCFSGDSVPIFHPRSQAIKPDSGKTSIFEKSVIFLHTIFGGVFPVFSRVGTGHGGKNAFKTHLGTPRSDLMHTWFLSISSFSLYFSLFFSIFTHAHFFKGHFSGHLFSIFAYQKRAKTLPKHPKGTQQVGPTYYYALIHRFFKKIPGNEDKNTLRNPQNPHNVRKAPT